jgi:hypothetical protein
LPKGPSIELLTSDALIERVQVNRIVDTAPAIREEGDIIIVPLLEEIVVVEKKAGPLEEIHMRRHNTLKHVREPIRLRSEQVSLERHPLPSRHRGQAMSDLTRPPGTGATGSASNQVVAMFETYDEALTARDALVAAGIDRSRIEILDRSAAEDDASFRSYDRNDEGFWGALKNFFTPDAALLSLSA